MSAAGGDSAHHTEGNHVLPGCRVGDCFENAAHGRFRDFRHVARRLIEGMAAVTYMLTGVKAKVPRKASRCGWRGTTTAAAPGAAAVAVAEAAAAPGAAAVAIAAAARSAIAG